MSALYVRAACGGALMGLANLVPGISGGTMLLAVGVYTYFIDAIADLSLLKIRPRPLALVGTVSVAAALAILLLAGPIKALVVDHRWIMYSLFIGLTLGGLPLVWRMARPITPAVWRGAALGFVLMLSMAVIGAGDGGEEAAYLPLFVSGLAGAAAMILPGVSGGYLLLLLGQYEVILGAVDQAKQALFAGPDWTALFATLHVVIPVGLGVVAGVVGVSNLLRWLLARYPKTTLGALLGLLVGAVIGLWPFQQAAGPESREVAYMAPSATQALVATVLIVVGFAVTRLIDRLGGGLRRADDR